MSTGVPSCKIGHVLFGKDPGDDTFVSVPPGHLVSHRELPLDGHIHFDHLDDPGRQFIASLQLVDLFLEKPL